MYTKGSLTICGHLCYVRDNNSVLFIHMYDDCMQGIVVDYPSASEGEGSFQP